MKYFYSDKYNECKEILKDYFEIKMPKQKKDHETIINKILKYSPLKNCEIDFIDGIVCNETLVVLKDEMDTVISHAYVLDKNSELKKHSSHIFRKKK